MSSQSYSSTPEEPRIALVHHIFSTFLKHNKDTHTHPAGRRPDPTSAIPELPPKPDFSSISRKDMKRSKNKVAQSTRREELTLEESNRVWNALIDPPMQTMRYGYGNQEVIMTQTAYRRSQAEE